MRGVLRAEHRLGLHELDVAVGDHVEAIAPRIADVVAADVGANFAGGLVRGRTAGYGLTGFNASSIYFSGQGCYRVTGRAAGAALSFVTLVRTCSVLPELTRRQRNALSKNWCPA